MEFGTVLGGQAYISSDGTLRSDIAAVGIEQADLVVLEQVSRKPTRHLRAIEKLVCQTILLAGC